MILQQKPPDLDESGNPVKPPDLDASGNTIQSNIPNNNQDESLLSNIWDTISQPIPAVKNWATNVGNSMTNTATEPGIMSTLKGFGAGALGGVADLMSPLNLGTAALGGAEFGALKAGLPTIAKLANIGSKVSGVPTAIHGMGDIFGSDNSLGQRAQGLGEVAGGILPFLHQPTLSSKTPKIESPIIKTELPPVKTEPPKIIGKIETVVKPNIKLVPNEPNAIIIKNPEPSVIKQVMEHGYELDRNNPVIEDGSIKYIKTSNPVTIPQSPPQAVDNMRAINQTAQLASNSQKPGLYRQLSGNIRAILTSFDLSAPGRQGMGLITHPEYWTSLGDMFKAWGSKEGLDAVENSIINKPSGLFSPTIRKADGTYISLAEKAGLNLGIEQFRNASLAEKVIPGVAVSERAFKGYLSKLSADVFDKLMAQAERDGLNPRVNLKVAKDLADSINTSTGRTSLGNIERSETAMKVLNETFFAPKLAVSRVKMYTRILDPRTYMNENPTIRKEALRSFLGIVGTTSVMNMLGKSLGADITLDPTNSDFGKIKLGNTRIDTMAGLQQFGVAATKILTGQSTSSTTGNTIDLTQPKFGGQTRASVAENMIINKLAPIPSFVWAWMRGKEFNGMPFEVKSDLANRTVPLVMQDLYDIYQDDPSLIPYTILPSIMGFGMQTYGR